VQYSTGTKQAAATRVPGRAARRPALLLAAALALLPLPGLATDMLTDFDNLEVPRSPNTWLVAPAGMVGGQADAEATVLKVSAGRLAAVWQAIVAGEERAGVTATSADGLQVEAEQRSALFGFTDDISFRALPRGDDRSTFIAYSRSRVGYWDLGVNQRRLNAWLAALRQRLADATDS
jgi:hypothetical protein